MKPLTSNDKQFIKYVKETCKQEGIKVVLRNSKSVKVDTNVRVSGYFDSEHKELVVARKHKEFLALLVHEFGHVTQWQENTKLWKDADNSIPKTDAWLQGKEIYNIKHHLSVVRDLELDNEKRSVKLIKKFKLNIDVPDYIRKANCYIHLYNYLYHIRRWPTPKNSPYKEKISSNMSSKFNMRYDVLPKKVYKLFEKERIGF